MKITSQYYSKTIACSKQKFKLILVCFLPICILQNNTYSFNLLICKVKKDNLLFDVVFSILCSFYWSVGILHNAHLNYWRNIWCEIIYQQYFQKKKIRSVFTIDIP